MRKTIQDVKVGDSIENTRNGEGVISDKTQRIITATFYNGNNVKLSYRFKDDYYYESDFQ